MSSVESIARIGGKGLSLDHIPGGVPVTSMEELMGSLAGLERGPELLIRASICGQTDQGIMVGLYQEAFHLAVKIGAAKGWRAVSGKPVFRGMGSLAVDELVYPQTYMCRPCGGTGRVPDQAGNPGGAECGCCHGRRTLPASGRMSAERCGIDRRAWDRLWVNRFPVVRDSVFDWYWTGVRHVNAQLRS